MEHKINTAHAVCKLIFPVQEYDYDVNVRFHGFKVEEVLLFLKIMMQRWPYNNEET